MRAPINDRTVHFVDRIEISNVIANIPSQTCLRDLAASSARGLAGNFWPSRNRGRREDRVRAAPAVSCAKRTKKTHTSIQVQRRHPAFPAQWFTAYSVLSPVNGSFATVAAWISRSIRRIDALPRDLTPAPRRQDHTTSPYASRALVLHTFRVHRIPPHVRDDREPPLIG